MKLLLLPILVAAVGTLSSTAKAANFGEEIEELANQVLFINDEDGEVLYRKDFPTPIPRAQALTVVQAELSSAFEVVTHMDLEEWDDETYHLNLSGVPAPSSGASLDRVWSMKTYGKAIKVAAGIFGTLNLGLIGGGIALCVTGNANC